MLGAKGAGSGQGAAPVPAELFSRRPPAAKPANRLKAAIADAQAANRLDTKLRAQRRELDRKSAADKLEQARARLRLLQVRARMAAASGDAKEATRAASEAAQIAREVGLAVRDFAKSAGANKDAEAAAAADPDVAGQPDAGQPAGETVRRFLLEARGILDQARSLLELAKRARRKGGLDSEADAAIADSAAALQQGDAALTEVTAPTEPAAALPASGAALKLSV